MPEHNVSKPARRSMRALVVLAFTAVALFVLAAILTAAYCIDGRAMSGQRQEAATSVLIDHVTTVVTRSSTAPPPTAAVVSANTSRTPSRAPATLGGLVWEDTDADAVKDPGETVFENLTVVLYRDTNGDGVWTNGVDSYIGVYYTDASGAYSVANLSPGDYLVWVEDETGTSLVGHKLIDRATNRSSVTLADGGAGIVDFPYVPNSLLASLTGAVTNDENANGMRDAGENGIANAIVGLYDGSSALSGRTVTDLEGRYVFGDLAPGTYTVRIDPASLSAGMVAHPATGDETTVNLVAGERVRGVDFGYSHNQVTDIIGNTGPGTIGNRVWLDADGDGIQDPGEAGFGGVTLELLYDWYGDGTFGATGLTTQTSPDGFYFFDNLPPGVYQVVVTGGADPSEYTQTGDPDGAFDSRTTAPIVLAPGDTYLNVDFGYQSVYVSGEITGAVWFYSRTAYHAPTPPLAGVSVNLIMDVNANHAWDIGEPIVATDITDINGTYSFPSVPGWDGAVDPLDTFLVWVSDVNGILNGLEGDYETNSSDNDGPRPTSGLVTGFDISACVPTESVNFDYTPLAYSGTSIYIGEAVYLDLNANGFQDIDEPGIEGVAVQLFDFNSMVLLDTQVTNANGQYFFGALAQFAEYYIVVDTSTLPSAGTSLINTSDPDGGADSMAHVVALLFDEGLADFGYSSPESNAILGTIWDDADGDGIQDPDESSGYDGVTLALRDGNGNLVGTTTTQAGGQYFFMGIPNDTYTVEVTDDAHVLLGTWHSLGAQDQTADGTSKATPYSVTVADSVVDTIDFGYYSTLASVSGLVWEDTNGNGIQEAPEPGIAGVAVTLIIYYPDGTVTVWSTTTDANGIYRFDGLLADENYDGVGFPEPTYYVSVTPPAGYTPTLIDQGGDDTIDSDDPTGTYVTAVLGQTIEIYDYGFLPPPPTVGDLGGTVYLDTNGNGVYDLGTDTPLPGINVTITDASGGIHVVTTDGSGHYSAAVEAGDAVVDVEDADVPAGYTLTTDASGEGSDPRVVTVPVGGTVTANTGYVDSTGNTGTVEGTVYIDNDGDGVYSPGIDDPLPNVTVVVTDANGGIYTVTTNGYGGFSAAVAAGVATVDVQDADLPPTAFLTSGSTDPTSVNIPAGGTADTSTGYVLPAGTGLVQGTVYIDENANGHYDSSDTPTPGVDVVMATSDLTTVTVTTDGNGYFQAVVATGSTVVDVDQSDPDFPPGLSLTEDSHGEGSDPTVVSVTDGGSVTDNTGYVLSASVGTVEGVVYHDADGSGDYGAGDALLAGIGVTVTDANGGIYAVTTDASGHYSAVVAAGDAVVDVEDADIPAGYTLTTDASGDGSDPSVVAVPAGGTATDNTGYVDSTGSTGTVEGTVYIDNNANGVYDAGTDTPLPNVAVTITDANGGVYIVTTDEDGHFGQTVTGNATPDNTTVDVSDLDLAAEASLTTDVSGEGSDPTTVAVTVGGTATDNTGYVLPAGTGLVQGTLYIDNNKDGLYNDGDTPIPNITVLITKSDASDVAATTDGNGYFKAVVPAGPTVIDIDQTDPDLPGGLSLTTDAHGEGTDPTPVSVPDGGAATDNTGTVYLATPAFGVQTACSTPKTGGVLVHWSTEVELGVLRYLVQVAKAGSWTTVGNILARTEGLSGASYDYLDRGAKPGDARMYRLLCVDVDGGSRAHVVGEATALAEAPALAAERATVPTFPTDGVFSVKEMAYSVQRHATKTPAMLGTARKATITDGGLYATGSVSRVYNLGCQLPDLGGVVYIRPYTDPYTDANVVWGSNEALSIDGEPGTPPEPPAQGVLGQDGYLAIVHVERDETLALNSMLPPGPNWFYGHTSRLAPGNAPILIASAPSPAAAGTASIRVAVRSTTNGAHDLGVTVNSVPVARATWSGKGHHLVTVQFDLVACPLLDGDNQIQLWTTAINSSKRLDYVEVVTPATPALREGSLVVDVAEGGADSLDVPGASYAVDVTEFGHEFPIASRRGTVGGLHAGQKLYLSADISGTLDWSAPKDLSAVDAALAGKQYVAVAPASWLDILAPLVAKHQAEGVGGTAVSVEDVYDAYGCGLPTPAGLVRLGQRVHPKYVLIAAGASHDPKGLEGDLPPPGIATGFIHVYEGTASTDDLYTGDFSIAVGRLPARTRDELTNMVNKIVDFYPGRRAVMMADVADATMGFGSFAEFQADLAQSLPSLLLDANGMDGTAVRAALIDAINDGANLVTYQGHGNNALIGDEFDILNTTHASQIPPSAWLLATCLTGVYTLESANTEVLSCSLLRTAGNGAVSVLASTCYGRAGVEHSVVESAIRQIASADATWGEILLDIKRTFLPDETVAVYTLLGDPAMHTLNPVAGAREILIREPVAGGYVGGGRVPVIRFGLRGSWWRQRLEISWRRDYGPWTPLQTITVDPEVFEYTIPWEPAPEDGPGYQIMIREVDETEERR